MVKALGQGGPHVLQGDILQALFDGFLGVLGTQSTPKTVRTFAACSTFPSTSIAVVTTISNVVLVTGLNRVSDEDNSTIGHQDMSTTLVVA